MLNLELPIGLPILTKSDFMHTQQEGQLIVVEHALHPPRLFVDFETFGPSDFPSLLDLREHLLGEKKELVNYGLIRARETYSSTLHEKCGADEIVTLGTIIRNTHNGDLFFGYLGWIDENHRPEGGMESIRRFYSDLINARSMPARRFSVAITL